MGFIKRGDGKILGVVDESDEQSKKSAKDASEKVKPSNQDTNKKAEK